ncbi:hypothetical protein NXS15_01470 [Mycoplasma sp. CSL7475-4]|uniref:hypothetical protein n=1 Tax=Mycoplasma sp. CSL7475-4 TaxID=2973942 RepID=UPI00216AF3CB|nr:hypothetical protein [Mycoplasma sp. CSL7475-4]MCS4536793.1 hypothetical protein [Mycoplasma sp. CSL7475-4]
MKLKKLLPTTITIIPLTTPSISVAFINTINFPLYQNFDIVVDEYASNPGVIDTIQQLFPNNLVIDESEHPYTGVISYKFKRSENTFNLLRIDSQFITKNTINLTSLPPKYKNKSFDAFWTDFKREITPFLISNNDIFNVSNDTKKPLFIENGVLSNFVIHKKVQIQIDKPLSPGPWKFSDMFKHQSDSYYLNPVSSKNAMWVVDRNHQQNEHPDESLTVLDGSLTIKNNEYWPSILRINFNDFVFQRDNQKNNFFLSWTQSQINDYIEKHVNSLYKLNLWEQIQPKLQNFNDKYLVKNNNDIDLTVVKNKLTFSTTISYLDEDDIEKYVYDQWLKFNGITTQNNQYYLEVEFDDYVDFVNSFGTEIEKQNIYKKLIRKFGTTNITIAVGPKPNAIISYNSLPNQQTKINLIPKLQTNDSNKYWWNRFNINIPYVENNTNYNRKIFSLKSGVSVPSPDNEEQTEQYTISRLNSDDLTLLSQAIITLVLSPKRNEELIINDNVIPVSLTGFKYQIKPNDKKIKIQIKVYSTELKNDVNVIDKNNFNVFTITENLFGDIGISSTFDEIEFKAHKWNPSTNLEQAQKINPYIIDANFKEVKDKNDLLIPNPDYDYKISPETGIYEQIWTLNSTLYTLIDDLKLWPSIAKLNEQKLIEYFAEEKNSVIAKTIFADSGLTMKFDKGFNKIDVFYLGNDIDSIKTNRIQHFKLSVNSQETLYYTTPKGEGWYLLSAEQKTGLNKYYLIYQTNEKFKQGEQQNILDRAFAKFKDLNMVNDINSSKYFISFKEYIKEKSLDILALKYSDLVIEYENFLLYNNITFKENFKNLKEQKFISDFEKYLINNQKFKITNLPGIKKISQNNGMVYIEFDKDIRKAKNIKLLYELSGAVIENNYKKLSNNHTALFDFSSLNSNESAKIKYLLIDSDKLESSKLQINISTNIAEPFQESNDLGSTLAEYVPNNYEKKPELNQFKDLLIEFIKSKMQNNIDKNIYNYLNSFPIENIEPEKFTYLDAESDKNVSVNQPNKDINEYQIEFNFNLNPNTTIIKFVKQNDKHILNLTNWLKTKGYQVNWPIKINLNFENIKQKLSYRTMSDWSLNSNKLKDFILRNITNIELDDRVYGLNDSLNLNGKDILVKDIVDNIKNVYLTFTDDNLFVDIEGNIEISDEKLIISRSNYKIEANWAQYSNPLDFYKPSALSYDGLNIEQIKEKLNSIDLLSNFEMNTVFEDLNYDLNFEYLKDFEVLNLLNDIDILATDEYTRYLTDEELEADDKKLVKNIKLINPNNNFIIEHIINEVKSEQLVSEEDIDFNKSYDEVKISLKNTLNDKYIELEKKYELMKRIIKHWYEKASKTITISNHSKTMYKMPIDALLSQMDSFEFVIDDKQSNDYFNTVNDFFERKRVELASIKNNPEKYRFNGKAIKNYERWLEFGLSLNDSIKKDILYNFWNFLESQANKLSKNKTEKIRLFAHFYTKLDIENVINNVLNGIKLQSSEHSLSNVEHISQNIYNNVSLNEKYYQYDMNIILVSPLDSITGEYSLNTIIYSNINPKQIDESQTNNDVQNDERIDIRAYKFKDIDFIIENEYLSELKNKFIRVITSNILNVFSLDDNTKSKIFNDLIITKFDDKFFNSIFNQKDIIVDKNGKKYYKITKNIKLNAKQDSTIVFGENAFNVNFYININFKPDAEAKEVKKKKIIWISSAIVAILFASGIITTISVLNKKQRKVKLF